MPSRALAAGLPLVALALLTTLSMGWASDNGGAFAEAVRVAGYLGLFVLVVVAAPAGSARAWLTGLALGLAGVAALALASRIQPSWFPEQDLVTFLPSVRTRLSYPLNYWNALGACMALAAVLLVWLSGTARTRIARALAAAAIPIPALALFLTSSRGGVVALAIGIGVLITLVAGRAQVLAGVAIGGAASAAVIVFANGRQTFVDGLTEAPGAAAEGREVLLVILLAGALAAALRWAADPAFRRIAPPRRFATAAAVAFAAVLVAGAVAADPAQRLDEFNDPPADPGPTRGFVTRHLASAEGSGRYQFWEAGIDAFESQPVRGVGAGGYEAWWAQHGSLAYYIRDAHSLFVEVAAELGLLGLLCLLGFLGAAGAGGFAARAADPRAGPETAAAALAVMAAGTTSAAIDWTWELPAAFAPVVVAAAVLAGPALAEGIPRARLRFGLGLATIAVAWVAVVGAAILTVSEMKLADSRDAARGGDLGQAESDADTARGVAPWSGDPHLQLALVKERAGDLAGARASAADAAERDPDDWRVWLVATRLAVRAGDVEEARRALRRARTLNPRSPLFAATTR